MFQIFPSLKKVKVGSPRHFLSNNVRPTVPIFCKSFFGSKPATKLLKPVILFATFYMSRTVCLSFKMAHLAIELLSGKPGQNTNSGICSP